MVIGVILFLLLIVLLSLKTSYVQNRIKSSILNILSEQYRADFSIGKIYVSGLDEAELYDILFRDQLGDTLLYAKSLHVDIGIFSLLGNQIWIDQVELTDARSKIYNIGQDSMNFTFLLPEKDSTNFKKPSSWEFGVSDIILNNPNVYYRTPTQQLDISDEKLFISFKTFDLENKNLALSILESKNLNLTARTLSVNDDPSSFTLPNLDWKFSAEEMLINKSTITSFDLTDSIFLNNLTLKIDDTEFIKGKAITSLKNLSVNYNQLVTIQNAKGLISLDSTILLLKDVDIKTESDNVSIQKATFNLISNELLSEFVSLDLSYPTIQLLDRFIPKNVKIQKNTPIKLDAKTLNYSVSNLAILEIDLAYGKVVQTSGNVLIENLNKVNKIFNIDIKSLKSTLSALDDVLVDVEIPENFQIYNSVNLKIRAIGTHEDLIIDNLDLKVDDDIALKLVGKIRNAAVKDALEFDVNILNLQAKVDRLPIPPNNQLALDSLGNINFKGNLKGNLRKVAIFGDLKTNLGSLASEITLLIPDSLANLGYKGNLQLKDFQLGKFLKNDTIGALSFNLNLDGKGTALATINTLINGKITKLNYQGYTYNDIVLDAKISDSTIDGKVKLNDKNVKFDYNGKIILKDEFTIFNFDLRLDTINTNELGLMDRPINASGLVHSEFQIPISPQKPSILKVKNLNMSNASQTFHSDSLVITGTKNLDTVSLDLRSSFGNIDIDGVFQLKDLPTAFEAFMAHHWPQDSLTPAKEFISKDIAIRAQIYTLQPLAVFLQDSFLQAGNMTVDIKASFVDFIVNGNVTIDSLIHNEVMVEQLIAKISTKSEAIKLDIKSKNNTIKGQQIDLIALKNKLVNGEVASQFLARDGDDVPRLKFDFYTNKEADFINISLKDSFVLNQQNWLIDGDNSIKIYPDWIFIDKLAITDNNEYMTVQSIGEGGKDINVDFKNFNIAQFTTLLKMEPSKFKGEVNGNLDIKDAFADMYFITNLKVDNMTYDTTSVGVLNLNADANPKTKIVTTNVSLQGPINDVVGGGTYNIETKIADFKVNIKTLDMLILNPFLSSIMVDSKGKLSGTASLKGIITKPNLTGSIKFDDVTTTIVANNSRYNIDDHIITFNSNSIDIGSLKIKDTEGNSTTLSGKIYHTFLEDIKLDIKMNSDKFTFLNTTSGENPVFFGKVVLDANATIKGPYNELDVEVVAKTLENSAITLSPFAGENVKIEEQFITYGKPQDFNDLTNEYLLKLNRQFPFNVNLLVDATKDAKFTFVIDPISGDKIEATGNGDLNVKLKPDGNQEIYGVYTVGEGFYDFSYGDFVSKKFEVKPGGTVRFNGNPLNAILDIDAVYNVYTTTYELVKNEISISEAEVSAAKKRTNVKVYLSLKGTLENPNITLDIEVPELQSSNLVSAMDRKLKELRNNPNELNNQVFGLLIFDSFILSDNASSGFDNLGSNIALSSISNLVSSQLNRLASNVIKGVDINVNVNSYESGYINNGAGGNVTELGVQVSKQLFNERLSLSAGGNFDIAQGASSGGYSSFIGDFVLKYKLTDDGRYQIRVFSKADYDRLLNANTNRNGVSIFFNQSFDSKINDKK